MTAQPSGAGLELLRSDVRRRLFDHLSSLPAGTSTGATGHTSRQQALSAQELAEVVGLHLTTVRFHLDQLVDAGLLMAVRAAPSGGAGRPRKLYSVPTVPMQAPTEPHALQAYAALSEIVTRATEQSASPSGERTDHDQSPLEQTPRVLEESGREWARDRVDRVVVEVSQLGPATTPGAWLAKIGVVLDLLVGWGHAPELRTTAGTAETDILLRDCPFLALAKDQPHLVCGVHRGLLRGALDALGEESVELDLAPLVDQRTCRAHLTVTTPFADRGEQR
ncbi:helix-turn-helix transcriptional regulator [Ornithinimicrobium cryptoxanthini]|uniref:Helix-turn-helix domain-containing protein n=1 Tax=Ornithinimicrobium cryptoxanthini TaxID=2934161 RepID=A0ABY4YM97_9MICO|nr:helix-turn-helix domain-containing protein [Ornithinimicrobium cryptoxanthini]USQ77923.1 helix-turn-helix domain-containing protein [Ornithinimicrobium cryptoxanthini]